MIKLLRKFRLHFDSDPFIPCMVINSIALIFGILTMIMVLSSR